MFAMLHIYYRKNSYGVPRDDLIYSFIVKSYYKSKNYQNLV